MEKGVKTMRMEWASESLERTTRFTLAEAKPMDAYGNDRRFLPQSVVVTAASDVSVEDPEVYGPRWEATVHGVWLKADGTPGKQEHVERVWQGRGDVPGWLATLGERCIARMIAGEPVTADVAAH